MIIKISGLQPLTVTSIADFAPSDTAEVTTITTVADSNDSLENTWFTLNSANDTNGYYVWYSTGTGIDPMNTYANRATLFGRTGLKVTIVTDDTDVAVAVATRAIIDAVGDFGAAGATNQVIITNAATGDTTNPVDGVSPTGFTFAETTPGATGIPTSLKMYKIVGTIPNNREEWQNTKSLVATPGATHDVTVIVPEKRIEYIESANL